MERNAYVPSRFEMNEMNEMNEGLQSLTPKLFAYLPRVAIALLVLVFGWLIARLIRTLLVRVIARLDQLWQRLMSKSGLEQLQSRRPPFFILGELFFWLVILVSITLATEILGLDVFGLWIREMVNFLPIAAAGVLIVLAGFVVGFLVRDLVRSAAVSANSAHGDLLGRVAQVAILFTAAVIGIDQIGIDIKFLSLVTGIVLAAFLGSIALAFGLGARTHVANIIAANQLRKLYRVGDKVKIGEMEGRITEIGVSRVIIESASDIVDVPAKLFDERITMLTDKGL